MPAYSSPLTDTLPPEVRIRIYREVLRANWPLAIARRESAGAFRYMSSRLTWPGGFTFLLLLLRGRKFQTSLLSVCKSVYYEASDVFFEVNTIHLRRYSELQRLFKVDRRFRNDLRVLQNVRFLRLVDEKYGPVSQQLGQWIHKARVDTHIKKCLTLPKLKECTFIYNRVPFQERYTAYNSPTSGLLSIVEHLRAATYSTSFSLSMLTSRSQGPTIRFVDKWLTKAWAQVKERGHINVVEEYIRASTLKICRGPEEFYDSCAGPAIWCALYDYCTQVGDNEVCQAMRGLRQEMQRRLAKIPISSSHAKLPQDLSLRDVSPELVGSDVMEWLSELLLHARLDSHALARLRDYLWSKR
ncbi:hypothetical protein D0859_09444 [Hortaea werneckii]|uniref:Uncharacterized protein n=1 Tax=Hortaea werneckii TaxID=91943 RepID=A0A3M7IMD3_HORWE|nr:hypothetical protein D0859_09444 [Hortaea werneckii]